MLIFKELKTILTKIDMHESEESKMARFVSGLRQDIQNVVELYEYTSLEKLVHLAIKAESNFLKKTSFKYTHNDDFYNSTWKGKNHISKQDTPSNFSKESTPQKEHPHSSRTKSPTQTSSQKCFKRLVYGHIAANCPTKRTMMVKGGIVVSEHSENEYEIPCEGDLLVIRRMLGTIPTPLDDTQRENIFHTRCLINKLCSMIIDGGCCTNVASTRVMEKLALPTISHRKPYKLQWLSQEGEIIVNKQVLITFAIGKYKDEVLCDLCQWKQHMFFWEGLRNMIDKFYIMA